MGRKTAKKVKITKGDVTRPRTRSCSLGVSSSRQGKLVDLLKVSRRPRNRNEIDKNKKLHEIDSNIKTDDEVLFELGRSSKSVNLIKQNEDLKKTNCDKLDKASLAIEIKSSNLLNISDQQELLKNFDLNPNYGPCRGISRRERYMRAIRFCKPVPDEIVLEILDSHQDDLSFIKCIWDQNELLKLHI